MSDRHEGRTPVQDTPFGPLRAAAALGALAALAYTLWEVGTAISWSSGASPVWRAQLLLLEGGVPLLFALGFGCAAIGRPAIRRVGWWLVVALLAFAIVWTWLVPVHPSTASYIPLRQIIFVSALDQATRRRVVEAAGRKYSAQLFTFGAHCCSRLGIDPTLAQDAVQDVFVTLLVEQNRTGASHTVLQDDPSQLKAYLFNAVQLRVQTLARSESRRSANEGYVASIEADSMAFSPADLHDATELEEYITATLAKCPYKAAHAYWLVSKVGLTYKEAGEVMGIATQTVGAHISSVAKQLRTAVLVWQASTSGDVAGDAV